MKKYIIFILLTFEILPISLVYNLKTRRIFTLGGSAVLQNQKDSRVLFTAVPILYKRESHIETEILDANLNKIFVDICEKRKISGSVFNLRYIYKRKFWAEFTTGYEKEHAITKGTINLDKSVKSFDDLVFSTGYNVFPTKKDQVTGYVIGGIPTTKSVTTDERFDTFVGTRFYGLGFGLEYAHAFVDRLEKSFAVIAQTRFLHFFKRGWAPILPCSATIDPGNVTDFLIAAQYRKMKNIIEVGYDTTFFTNQAIYLKSGALPNESASRQSFYMNFAHFCKRVPLIPNQMLVGGGFYRAYTKRYNTKTASYWLNFTVIF